MMAEQWLLGSCQNILQVKMDSSKICSCAIWLEGDLFRCYFGEEEGQAIRISLILLVFVHVFFHVAFIALLKTDQLAMSGSLQNTFPDYNKEKRCYTALLR